MNLKIYNPETHALEEERVALGWMAERLYNTARGRFFERLLFSRPLLSVFYGFLMRHPLSKRFIPTFIGKHKINMAEFETPQGGFKNFDDFFTRKLKGGTRLFSSEKNDLCSPAEGRLKAFQHLSQTEQFCIKGERFDLATLLAGDEATSHFQRGSCLIIRLCPSDYHRFHFFDRGTAHKPHAVEGSLHSVNPLSLRHLRRVFDANRRMITLFQSENFGRVMYIEVGALLVGSIRQTFSPLKPVQRGDEKGYFSFGGSTVILLFEPNRVRFDPEICERSTMGLETLIRCGSRIGQSER